MLWLPLDVTEEVEELPLLLLELEENLELTLPTEEVDEAEEDEEGEGSRAPDAAAADTGAVAPPFSAEAAGADDCLSFTARPGLAIRMAAVLLTGL